jgi:hypothetical protein
VQFGPTESADVVVSARIYGTAKGRRYPTFGVGLNGVAGWRLQVSPAKKALELYKDQDVKASVTRDWKPGEWAWFRLTGAQGQGRRVENRRQSVDIWSARTGQWMITFDEKEEPVAGCASVFGSPFSGTPIWFDDLTVERVGAK